MAPRVIDLDLKSVVLADPFTISCPQWIPRKYDNRPDPVVPTPLDLPEDLDQCCHVEVTGEYPNLKYKMCRERVIEKSDDEHVVPRGLGFRHGWLCHLHHAAQLKQTEREALHALRNVDRNGDWDVEPLKARLAQEVEETEGVFAEHLNYKDYSRWGWASQFNPFENDPEFEMVEEEREP